MSLQLVNTGTLPNDGTGDTIRSAFLKVNQNFASSDREINLSDVTVYVSATGNDNNGGLTADDPLATIQAAVNYFIHERKTATGAAVIQLADGTYSAPQILLHPYSRS